MGGFFDDIKKQAETFQKKADGLSQPEGVFVSDHPQAAYVFNADATTALTEARKRYPANTLRNGTGDAFRHCFWNSLMARDQGETLAKQFATAHEAEGGPLIESMMDLYNNEQGRAIGKANPKANDARLADLCAAALDADELLVIDGVRLVKSKSGLPYTPSGPRSR